MQIFVKTLTGNTITLDVESTDKVLKIMQLIEQSEKFPIPCQRVIYQGKQLESNRSLSDYQILKESTLDLIGRIGCLQIYVQWQGKWLKSSFNSQKSENLTYHNFRDDIYKLHPPKSCAECHNHTFDQTDPRSSLPGSDGLFGNLVVYHLQKIIAKFLKLKAKEITLNLYNDPQILDVNEPLNNLKQYIFVAKIK